MCGPSRTGRWRGSRGDSLRPHQADEDILERRLRGIEVGEADAGVAQVAQEAGDAGALALGVVIVDELASLVAEFEMIGRERLGYSVELALQMQRQAFPAELLH